MARPANSTAASFTDEIDDAVLQELYTWVDQIPLSRPKKNLNRDFADGVLVAETIAHYFPKIVELHNYPAATGTKLKMENWHVLNRKVFKKLHFELAEDVIKQLIQAKPFVIERVLLMLRTKIDTILWEKQKDAQNEQPEADQYKQDLYQGYQIDPYHGAYHGHPGNPYPYGSPGTAQCVISTRHGPRPINSQKDPTPREKQLKGTAPKPAGQKPPIQPNRKGPALQKIGGGDGRPPLAMQAPPPQKNSIIPADMVPRVQLEEKIQECLTKDETLQILEAKVRRLEHLLHLKDIRINELQTKLDHIRPTGMP